MIQPQEKSKYTIELAYLPSTKDTTTITNTNPNFGNILFKSIIEKNLIQDYLNHTLIKSQKKHIKIVDLIFILKKNGIKNLLKSKSVLLCNFDKNQYPDYVKNQKS